MKERINEYDENCLDANNTKVTKTKMESNKIRC
jgi:hypothetical protein